jgi:hypothetical protein
VDKKAIRKDKWLSLMMKLGIPLAIVSLASLWGGHLLANEALGKVFLVTMPVVLVMGFVYNIRYVMLAVRAQRATSDND